MSTKEALYAPLETQSRRGRGGVYQYVTSKDVMNRMNEVFGTNWSSEVLFQDVIGSNVVVRVRVVIQDPETKERYYQEGFGGAINDESAEAGNPFKSAYSKALRDACKKWGVGLYLDDEEVPSGAGSPGPSPKMSNPPQGFSGFETAPAGTNSNPPAPPQAPVNTQAPPTPPQAPPQAPTEPKAPSFTPPAANPEPQAPPIPQATTQPQAPPQPPQQQQSFNPPPAPKAEDKPMGSINSGPSMISDVQKAALSGLLVTREVPYEQLVAEAFESNGLDKSNIPEMEKLTYDQAVVVIKYGNNKFRRG